MKLSVVPAFLRGVLAVSVASQELPNTAAALNAEAMKAYQVKDYGRFLTYERRLNVRADASYMPLCCLLVN